MNMSGLDSIFLMADQGGYKYVGVEIRIGEDSVEYIIVKRSDFASKLKYYKDAYTDDLKLKANNSIRICDAVYGDTFNELERDLVYGI